MESVEIVAIILFILDQGICSLVDFWVQWAINGDDDGNGGIPATIVALMRVAMGGLILLPFVFIVDKPTKEAIKNHGKWFLLLGLIHGVHEILLATGLQYTSAIMCGVIYATQPFIAMVISSILGWEKITKILVLGLIFGICGTIITINPVLIIQDIREGDASSHLGTFLIFLDIIVYTIEIFVQKNVTTIFGPFAINSFSLLVGTAVVGIASIPAFPTFIEVCKSGTIPRRSITSIICL
ncbi:hypothetical protein ADUPG1_011040, partial [Aduncisulcus paluster]